MKIVRKANAAWDGNIKSGGGVIDPGYDDQGQFDQQTRYAENESHNPETMAAGALAGSYTMTLARDLAQADLTPLEIRVAVQITLDQNSAGEDSIVAAAIDVRAKLVELGQKRFLEVAEQAQAHCPIAQLFAGTRISLQADVTV